MAKGNVFKEASKIYKAHPKMAWADAVKKAGKQVAGVKRKPAAKKVAGTKRKRITARRVGSSTGSVNIKQRASTGAVGAIKQARAIMGKITKLEADRKKEKNRDMKDIIQVEINKQHDKLDALKRLKKKI